MSDEEPVRPAEDEGAGTGENAAESDAAESDEAGEFDDELTLGQRERERRIWLLLVLAGIGVVILFLIGFWPVMAGRLNAVKQVDAAQTLLGQAENSLGGVDEAVTAQLSPDAAPSVPDFSAALLVARRELRQAVTLVDDAMPHLTEDEQSQAQLVRTAAAARLVMVDRAPTILTASVKAVKAKSQADTGWQELVLASADETRAVQSYDLQTAAGVESASVAAERALGRVTASRPSFSQAATAFPQAGFDRYVAYTDARAKALRLLDTAAKRWLAGDAAQAGASYAAYSAAAAKANVAAQKLPYAPGTATEQAFKKMAGPALATYTKAKRQALDADKALTE